MGLKKAENQVKILLAETILAMCRNTLNNHAEVNVEGLLGITLDNDEIFLVSINQTISNPDVPSKSSKKQSVEENVGGSDANESTSRRKRAKSKTNDDSSSESDEETNKEGKTKKRRRKRKKRQGSKSSNEESGSSSESEENDIKPSIPHERNPGSQNNRNGQNSRSDSNENANSFSVMQDDTSLSNMSETVHVKKEMDDDDEEEDIVIIKEELADLPMSSDNQFMNLQQQYESGPFQPQDFNSSFPGTPQQSMSSNLSQPQPGPSSSNAGVHRRGLYKPKEFIGLPNIIQSNIVRPGIIQSCRGSPSVKNGNPWRYAGTTFQSDNQMFNNASSSTGASDAIDNSTSYPGWTDASNSLNNSLIINTGTSRICTFCGQSCQSRSALKIHMVTHTGEKTTTCKICGKSFTQKSSAVRHLKTVHDVTADFQNYMDS